MMALEYDSSIDADGMAGVLEQFHGIPEHFARSLGIDPTEDLEVLRPVLFKQHESIEELLEWRPNSEMSSALAFLQAERGAVGLARLARDTEHVSWRLEEIASGEIVARWREAVDYLESVVGSSEEVWRSWLAVDVATGFQAVLAWSGLELRIVPITREKEASGPQSRSVEEVRESFADQGRSSEG